VNKGLGILEWTGKLVPQGALVTGARTRRHLCPPWRCMSLRLPAHTPVFPPLPAFAGAKTCWMLSWQALMRELAPQSKDGSYQRPGYNFTGAIGEGPFPVRRGALRPGRRTLPALARAAAMWNACRT
jgi:hypothetical protein